MMLCYDSWYFVTVSNPWEKVSVKKREKAEGEVMQICALLIVFSQLITFLQNGAHVPSAQESSAGHLVTRQIQPEQQSVTPSMHPNSASVQLSPALHRSLLQMAVLSYAKAGARGPRCD